MGKPLILRVAMRRWEESVTRLMVSPHESERAGSLCAVE